MTLNTDGLSPASMRTAATAALLIGQGGPDAQEQFIDLLRAADKLEAEQKAVAKPVTYTGVAKNGSKIQQIKLAREVLVQCSESFQRGHYLLPAKEVIDRLHEEYDIIYRGKK